MPIARTYEEPDVRDEHVLFTHPRTSLRLIDPFSILMSFKFTDWAYPSVKLDGPYRMRALRDEFTGETGFSGQMLEWAIELDVIRILVQLGDDGARSTLAKLEAPRS